MLQDEKKIQDIEECIEIALIGARTGFGFYPKMDKLAALRYYAGVSGMPNMGDTPQAKQRKKVIERFMAEARKKGIKCTEVREFLRIPLDNGGYFFGVSMY